MAKSTGEPHSGYQKLDTLHVIGDNVVAAECDAYQRQEYARTRAQEARNYTDETVGREPTVKGYTRVG
jgi:hypothetical protein